MKKSKFMMTAITAVFAVSACGGALVACGDSKKPDDNPPAPSVYQVTFDANGGKFADGVTTVIATVDGALAALPAQDPTRVDYTFNGYTVNADGTGGEVKVGTAFTADATVYAQWKEDEEQKPPTPAVEYTITFDLHGGSFAEGTPTTYTTVNGKLAAVPSDPTKPDYKFKGYSLTDGGDTMTRVQLAAVEFDKNATVHAVWEEEGKEPVDPIEPEPDDGDYSFTVGGVKHEMTKHERGESDADTRLYEYRATGVELVAGDVVTFSFVGDENAAEDGSIEFWVSDEGLNACNGIEAVMGVKTASVKAVNGGTFDIYVKWYADNGGSFVLCMSDGTASGVTDPNGGVKPEPVVDYEFYLYGNIGGEEKWDVETGYKFEHATPDKGVWLQYSVSVNLAKGDRVKIFRSDKNAGNSEWGYNNYESDKWAYGRYETYAADNADMNFVVKQAGTFTFYIKIYDNGGGNPDFADDGIEDGNSVWVAYEEIKHEVGVSTITFDAGEGTLETTTAQTDVYGMLESLPTPVAPEGKEFDGWYTEPDGGVKVTVNKVYTADTTLYAQYKAGEENLNPVVGATNGTTPIAITDNTANKPATPENLMYEYMSGKVSLTEGDEIAFTVDGKPLTEFFTADCHGVTKVGSKFTVNETGEFDIYVRFYSTDPVTGAAPCWVIEITDGKVDELTDGVYYLVGSMSDWNKPSAAHELTDGAVTVMLAENTEFKIATVKGGKTDWDATVYSYTNISVGAAYVSAGKDGNIIIKQTGTYTITLADGKISITSEDVELPEVEVPAYSVTVTFKDGVKAVLAFDMPEWDGVDKKSAYIYIWGAGENNFAVAWPGINLSSEGTVEVDAITIDASDFNFKIHFKQSGATKESTDTTKVSVENGGIYKLTIGAWVGDNYNVNVTKMN